MKTYAAACRNHRQEIIAFICGTIDLLFASEAKSQLEINHYFYICQTNIRQTNICQTNIRLTQNWRLTFICVGLEVQITSADDFSQLRSRQMAKSNNLTPPSPSWQQWFTSILFLTPLQMYDSVMIVVKRISLSTKHSQATSLKLTNWVHLLKEYITSVWIVTFPLHHPDCLFLFDFWPNHSTWLASIISSIPATQSLIT